LGWIHAPSESTIPKAVGVAIGSPRPAVAFDERTTVYEVEPRFFFTDVGAGAVEENVTVGTNGFDGDAMVGEDFVLR